MDGSADVCEHSLNSVQSTLKPPLNSATKKGESVHSFGVDVGDAPLKGDYELAPRQTCCRNTGVFEASADCSYNIVSPPVTYLTFFLYLGLSE